MLKTVFRWPYRTEQILLCLHLRTDFQTVSYCTSLMGGDLKLVSLANTVSFQDRTCATTLQRNLTTVMIFVTVVKCFFIG